MAYEAVNDTAVRQRAGWSGSSFGSQSVPMRSDPRFQEWLKKIGLEK